MFSHLIAVYPLGFLYGSAGAFLSPENLVGRSGGKFPPDATTLAGLILNAHREQPNQPTQLTQTELSQKLTVAGPFWANASSPEYFYVPIPRHKIIGDLDTDQWQIQNYRWWRDEDAHPDAESEYHWHRIDAWDYSPDDIKINRLAAKAPWQELSMLHPSLKTDERHVRDENGLFLENAVQMLANKWDGSEEETCLVYLSTAPVEDGWYRFGGESHMVELTCIELDEFSPIVELLKRPIEKAFALIGPGIWGSNSLSLRYPRHSDFSERRPMMLTDRPIPYRYRNGGQPAEDKQDRLTKAGRLSRGRYAVPPGTVYVFKEAIGQSWWDWPEEWFPKEGFPLKHLGCNLSLPVEIQGAN